MLYAAFHERAPRALSGLQRSAGSFSAAARTPHFLPSAIKRGRPGRAALAFFPPSRRTPRGLSGNRWQHPSALESVALIPRTPLLRPRPPSCPSNRRKTRRPRGVSGRCAFLKPHQSWISGSDEATLPISTRTSSSPRFRKEMFTSRKRRITSTFVVVCRERDTVRNTPAPAIAIGTTI